MIKNIIFDFDSTLVQNESFNDVLKLALTNDIEKIKQVEGVVNKAMNGLITPQESMDFRLKTANFNKTLINKVINETKITDGITDLVLKLRSKYNIFIVSGGFKEMIIPIAKQFNIIESEIFANTIKYDGDNFIGVEPSVLLQEQGKVKMLNELRREGILVGDSIMVGDGYTDLETEKFKAVKYFIAFFGVIKREKVEKEAKLKANNVKELENIVNRLSVDK
jgi:HAD superfamily phosphoserine phosphatase-like hydrolase